MKNNKGQALVEFIVILPVLLLVVMAMVDFGNIIMKKYAMENDLDTVVDMYESNESSDINTYINDNNLSISYSSNDNYMKITLSKSVKVITPILNNILGNNYDITVSRTVMNSGGDNE